MTATTILAGDIGGTHARFARVAATSGRVALEQALTYPVAEAASLQALVERYLDDAPGPVAAAAIGIAAPIVDGRAAPINLPWPVAETEVQAAIGHTGGRLLNDLVANAWGIGELADDDLVELQPDGLGSGGNRVVCSAGTGLGSAGIIDVDGRGEPFASEGGHVDFAPHDADERALQDWLLAEHPDWGRVSTERVASGPGIHDTWRFLCATGRAAPTAALVEAVATGDPSIAISAAALAGDDPSAVRTMEIFTRVYGAHAGNASLLLLATGGVFLGGGIAPRILPLLQHGPFLAAFRAKGRYTDLLSRVAVRVILDDRCALRGAARYALTRLEIA